ncbi:MAG: pyridoxal-phosphate-dependent aminotransferase family protein [Pirellulales bacterium]
MLKRRLMTPGPTQVPEPALLSLARQVTHHRTAEFRALFAEVLEGLKYVFQTTSDVIVLTSSGTGAMEAAVVNLVPRGGKAIVLESGKFAERWRKICEVYGIEVVRHEVPWGEPFRAEDVAALLQQHPDAAAVYGTLMESSTGVGHDIEAIGRVVGPTKALFVVDAISGGGVMECRTDAWGVDVLVVGAQKALMLPPGLAFLTVNAAAWRRIERIERPAFYFDLLAYRRVLDGPDTPFTPAHVLIAALAENLKQIRAEGMEAIWARARTLSRATRAGVEAMGLAVFPRRPAEGMTAVRVPEGLDGGAFLKRLETRFGVKLAGGQGPIQGKIFRIAHMGIVDELDILGTLSAMELVLHEMGRPVTVGAAATAAARVLAEAQGPLPPGQGRG